MNRLDYTKDEYLHKKAVNYTKSLSKFNHTFLITRLSETQSYLERLETVLSEKIKSSKPSINQVEKTSVILKMIAGVMIIPFWLFIVWFMYKMLNILSKNYQRDKKTKEGFNLVFLKSFTKLSFLILTKPLHL